LPRLASSACIRSAAASVTKRAAGRAKAIVVSNSSRRHIAAISGGVNLM
jgi:hypothetical protein